VFNKNGRMKMKLAGAAMAGAVVSAVATYQLVPRVPPAQPSAAQTPTGPKTDDSQFVAVSRAMAKEPTRRIAGRVTGLGYAPPPLPNPPTPPSSVSMSASASADAKETTPAPMSADLHAALDAMVPGTDDKMPFDRLRAQRAGALTALMAGRYDETIGTLLRATQEHPDDATLLNDLSAALLERSAFDVDRSDLNEAFTAVTRALAYDPELIEAHFNRALILERLGDKLLAARAWDDYRRRDPKGPWSEEAARHSTTAEPAPPQKSKVTFQRVPDFSSLLPPQLQKLFQPWVSHGTTSRDYPASFYAAAQECTATLIGPSVVLTSAHCLTYPQEQPESIELANGFATFTADCDVAPGYNPNGPRGQQLQDWALCKATTPQTIPAEVVNTDKRLTERGSRRIRCSCHTRSR
jgi:hypothetical protein